MAERTVHFSDLSGEMIQNPAEQLVNITVVDHPDIAEPVHIEAMPQELESLEKLVVKQAVTIEVQSPGEEEPVRHVLTATNFAKLAADRPMAEVLKEAKPVEVSRKVGGTAVKGAARDHNSLEWAGTPHKGKTSPDEARLVRENLEAVNKRLAEQGLRTIDPTNADHAKRYGFGAEPAQEPVEPAAEA
jgi:hypothetical protein